MRHEKLVRILGLARELAGRADRMTLAEMGAFLGESRSTAERARRLLADVFPQFEEVPDHPHKRFRIPRGLDGFFQDPNTAELACLGVAIRELQDGGKKDRAALLSELDRKIRAAMRLNQRRKTEPDVEVLMRAELIAMQAGPRAAESPAHMALIREALLGMKALRFTYFGGTTPGSVRDVVPLGVLFGRCNYLIANELGSEKAKSWRLDRIDNVSIVDVVAKPPDGFDFATFTRGWFGFFDEKPQDVILHILPGGRDDFKNFQFHASQKVEELETGGVLVRFRASGMQELIWHLFTWGSKIEIIEPVSLRQHMTSDLTATLAHHQEPLRHSHKMNLRGTAA